MMKMLAPDVDPDESDVHFVLEQCDDDENGTISRDELLPVLAVWKQVAQEKPPAAATEETPREGDGEEGEQAGDAAPAAAAPTGASLSRESTKALSRESSGGVKAVAPADANGAEAATPAPAQKSSACVLL